MTKHTLPMANWHMALADIIERADDGDVVIVPDEFTKELGERAKQRMCPDKKLTFEVNN